MEECELREVTTPIDIDIRKKKILEKIKDRKKLSVLKRTLINFKTTGSNDITSIDDIIAIKYYYIFDDLTTTKYPQYLNDIVYMAVNWWKQQLYIHENENDNNSSLELFDECLSKIVLYEIYNNGYCELATNTKNDNEPLMIAKYISGIDYSFKRHGSMFIDKEGSTLGTNPDECDYSVLKKQKTFNKKNNK